MVVNGKIYPFAPPMAELRAMIEQAYKGRGRVTPSGRSR